MNTQPGLPLPARGIRGAHDKPSQRGAPSPLWLPETTELFRQLSERAPGAFGNPSGLAGWLAATDAPDLSPLVQTLEKLQTDYLGMQRLPGTLHFDRSLPAVDAPQGPLRSVLEHLVDGGLRGNDSHRPYCHIGLTEQTDSHVTLYVKDNGQHVPECSMDDLRSFIRNENIEKVPDRVYRLFLADNLVQWLGGTLWIGPAPNGVGTTVFLRLPREKTAKANPGADRLLARHVF